ncbi:tyrosine-type recombinase/integrase [Micromonospora carbonacea]|uniref:tyrosine-type recombinase/integrase n=1 Tax=Micromonospora carbonacea TaxID=47853 RepID=UPI003724AACD
MGFPLRCGHPETGCWSRGRGVPHGLSPNNVRRQWRQARADTDLAWVTPHTFRKTVATPIKEETNTKNAAAQLGHSSEEVTATYYIAKPVQAPDSSDVLERLGADRNRRPTPREQDDDHG